MHDSRRLSVDGGAVNDDAVNDDAVNDDAVNDDDNVSPRQ
jgi:hypothetical protein